MLWCIINFCIVFFVYHIRLWNSCASLYRICTIQVIQCIMIFHVYYCHSGNMTVKFRLTLKMNSAHNCFNLQQCFWYNIRPDIYLLLHTAFVHGANEATFCNNLQHISAVFPQHCGTVQELLLRSCEGWQSIIMRMSVCVSVCSWTYPLNHLCELYEFFSILPITVAQSSSSGVIKVQGEWAILIGSMTWVGSRYHVLDGGPDPPRGRGNFGGRCSCPL